MTDKKGKTSPEKRPPAQDLLTKFLQDNNLTFTVRRQQVEHTDAGRIVISPPVVVVMYKDQATKANNG